MTEFGPQVIVEISTDPKTGRHTSMERHVSYTKAEKEQRLAEMAKAEKDEAERTKTALKDELIAMQSKAKEVRELIREGIFDDADLELVETRIEELKAELRA